MFTSKNSFRINIDYIAVFNDEPLYTHWYGFIFDDITISEQEII